MPFVSNSRLYCLQLHRKSNRKSMESSNFTRNLWGEKILWTLGTFIRAVCEFQTCEQILGHLSRLCCAISRDLWFNHQLPYFYDSLCKCVFFCILIFNTHLKERTKFLYLSSVSLLSTVDSKRRLRKYYFTNHRRVFWFNAMLHSVLLWTDDDIRIRKN